jgi:hypothetical protein
MVCGYEENVILTVENRTSEGLQEEHFVEVPLTGPGNGSRHVPINVTTSSAEENLKITVSMNSLW